MAWNRRSTSRGKTLRLTLLWGDFVVARQELRPGKSARFGDRGAWAVPPEARIPSEPIRSSGADWLLDATGADDGIARVGGVESPVSGDQPLRLAAVGDSVVLRYGPLAVAAQVARRARPLPGASLVDPLLVAASAYAAVVGLGGLGLVFFVTGRAPQATPPALQRPDELARAYYLDASQLEGGQLPPAAEPSGQAPELSERAVITPVAAALQREGPGLPTGGLSFHAVSGVVLARYSDLESCGELRSNLERPSPAPIRIELTVGPSGIVQRVRFLGTELGDDLVQCVGDQLRRFQFPPAAESTTTRLTLRLGAEGERRMR